MSDRRKIHKNLKQLQVIKTWQLLIVLLLMVFVSATFLRLNNTGMIQRRNAIESADKVGDPQEITSRIYDLQRYSAAHMNADSGVFYLQEQYDRDVKTAMAAADGDSSTGDNSPQARADKICNPNLQIHGYSQAYQDCMLRELSKAGQVVDPSSIKLPSPALYRYEFLSPLWSPDFAGVSILITLLIAVLLIARLAVLGTLRLLLHHYYRRA